MTSGLVCEFWHRRLGGVDDVQVGWGGARWGYGGHFWASNSPSASESHSSPLCPPRQSRLARGRGPFSGMLTRLAGSPGRPHSWPSGAMNSVLSTSSRGLYSLLRVGGRGGGLWGGGPGPAILDVFPELGSHPGQGLGVVPSASDGGWGGRTSSPRGPPQILSLPASPDILYLDSVPARAHSALHSRSWCAAACPGT